MRRRTWRGQPSNGRAVQVEDVAEDPGYRGLVRMPRQDLEASWRRAGRACRSPGPGRSRRWPSRRMSCPPRGRSRARPGVMAKVLGVPRTSVNHSCTKRTARSSTVLSTYSCWLRMSPPLCVCDVGRSPAAGEVDRAHQCRRLGRVPGTSSYAVYRRAMPREIPPWKAGARRSAVLGAARGRLTCEWACQPPPWCRRAGPRGGAGLRRDRPGIGLTRSTIGQTKEEPCRSGPRRKCCAWCRTRASRSWTSGSSTCPGSCSTSRFPPTQLTEDVFEEGFGFDGSSIRGFQEIQESDMLLMPDPNTAVIDPFREHRTLNLNCFVRDPVTLEPYSRDPRVRRHEGRGLPRDDRARRHLLLRARGRVLHLRRRPLLPGPATRLLPGRLGRGALELGHRRGPEPRVQDPPQRGVLPGPARGPLPGPAVGDDPHHGAPGHRDRGAAPRGGDRGPGRDRHALRHACSSWPTSSCSTSTW